LISRRSKLTLSGAALLPLSWIFLATQLPSLMSEGQTYEPPHYFLRLVPLIWWMFILGGLFVVVSLVSLAFDNRKPR
jgi:hypothetical protein